MSDAAVLDDVLVPGLRVAFCGTQAGAVSAARGAYYAGPGNKFWPTLHAVGLTPRRLAPEQFREVVAYGIGLTDVAKTTSGPDTALQAGAADAAALRARILHFAPAIVAFNGKRAAALALGRPGRELRPGLQPCSIGASRVFVLPSTSGAAAGFWDLQPWKELAQLVRR